MPLKNLPALFMRGGTSNGLVFDLRDLPDDRDAWGPIFVAAMGSPDPNRRQLDGMGGGVSSLSKLCAVGPASREDDDIDCTVAQVSIDGGTVDFTGNCMRMVSAIGPAALEFGSVEAEGPDTRIRNHNTNTARVIVANFPVENGLQDSDGGLSIDGVGGAAAPIRLDFLDPGGGAKQGSRESFTFTTRAGRPQRALFALAFHSTKSPCGCRGSPIMRKRCWSGISRSIRTALAMLGDW